VVQTGQGADEVFGGYHWYPRLMDSNDLTTDYADVYFDRDHGEMHEALDRRFMNGDYSREFIDSFFKRSGGSRPVDKALQLDTDIMLVDDPVKRVDNMAMAWGVEARVPFLDHEVVELAARIPAELKVSHGGKYILKEAARSIVPGEVIDRRKGYFPVPALKFLRGPFLDFVREVLHEPRAQERRLFNPDYVNKLLADPGRFLTPKGHSKLWQIAVLECWLQTHGICGGCCRARVGDSGVWHSPHLDESYSQPEGAVPRTDARIADGGATQHALRHACTCRSARSGQANRHHGTHDPLCPFAARTFYIVAFLAFAVYRSEGVSPHGLR
jgi:Asparagine synthase